jgi:hypothetical protein
VPSGQQRGEQKITHRFVWMAVPDAPAADDHTFAYRRGLGAVRIRLIGLAAAARAQPG